MLDFGPLFSSIGGIQTTLPPNLGAKYKVWVPKADADGNSIPGVRTIHIRAPLGTNTGWNVRPGGRAPEYLRYDADLIRITRALFAANKPVAVVCHGIEIVAAADVIRGREVTTVAKCQFDCEFSGGTYVNREVVVSGNLVTCRTWHDNPAWMREYIKMLKGAK